MITKTIKSRYNEPRYFDVLSDGNYIIYGESDYMRLGGEPDSKLEFIDYTGGPFICVGCNLEHFNLNGVVKTIEPYENDKPNCYKLILEDGEEI